MSFLTVFRYHGPFLHTVDLITGKVTRRRGKFLYFFDDEVPTIMTNITNFVIQHECLHPKIFYQMDDKIFRWDDDAPILFNVTRLDDIIHSFDNGLTAYIDNGKLFDGNNHALFVDIKGNPFPPNLTWKNVIIKYGGEGFLALRSDGRVMEYYYPDHTARNIESDVGRVNQIFSLQNDLIQRRGTEVYYIYEIEDVKRVLLVAQNVKRIIDVVGNDVYLLTLDNYLFTYHIFYEELAFIDVEEKDTFSIRTRRIGKFGIKGKAWYSGNNTITWLS